MTDFQTKIQHLLFNNSTASGDCRKRLAAKIVDEVEKIIDARTQRIVDEFGHWEPDTNHTNYPEWAETVLEEHEEIVADFRRRDQ